MKNGRKSDLAKENVNLGEEIKDLKRQTKRMKTVIEKFKNRERPNKSKESKEKRIKSGSARKCKTTEGCIEKWATFSSAAIGPAASIIKQVGELSISNQHTFPGQFYYRKRPDHFKEGIEERRLLGGREHSRASSNSKPL